MDDFPSPRAPANALIRLTQRDSHLAGGHGACHQGRSDPVGAGDPGGQRPGRQRTRAARIAARRGRCAGRAAGPDPGAGLLADGDLSRRPVPRFRRHPLLVADAGAGRRAAVADGGAGSLPRARRSASACWRASANWSWPTVFPTPYSELLQQQAAGRSAQGLKFLQGRAGTDRGDACGIVVVHPARLQPVRGLCRRGGRARRPWPVDHAQAEQGAATAHQLLTWPITSARSASRRRGMARTLMPACSRWASAVLRCGTTDRPLPSRRPRVARVGHPAGAGNRSDAAFEQIRMTPRALHAAAARAPGIAPRPRRRAGRPSPARAACFGDPPPSVRPRRPVPAVSASPDAGRVPSRACASCWWATRRACAGRLRAQLDAAGHRVVEAADGRQGLSLAIESAAPGDAGRPGGGRTRRHRTDRTLRQFKAGRSIYVMILSDRRRRAKLVRAFEAGADGFLPCRPAARAGGPAARRHARGRPAGGAAAGAGGVAAHLRRTGVPATSSCRRSGMTDMLTGCPTGATPWIASAGMGAMAVRTERPLACMVIDMDNLKQINDAHGHAAGDTVHQTVASAFKGEMRAQDVLARSGGDEFIVICPDTALDAALACAERMRAAVGGAAHCRWRTDGARQRQHRRRDARCEDAGRGCPDPAGRPERLPGQAPPQFGGDGAVERDAVPRRRPQGARLAA
jgi:diguanylate cyclase (GGDEF)-like protein